MAGCLYGPQLDTGLRIQNYSFRLRIRIRLSCQLRIRIWIRLSDNIGFGFGSGSNFLHPFGSDTFFYMQKKFPCFQFFSSSIVNSFKCKLSTVLFKCQKVHSNEWSKRRVVTSCLRGLVGGILAYILLQFYLRSFTDPDPDP